MCHMYTMYNVLYYVSDLYQIIVRLYNSDFLLNYYPAFFWVWAIKRNKRHCQVFTTRPWISYKYFSWTSNWSYENVHGTMDVFIVWYLRCHEILWPHEPLKLISFPMKFTHGEMCVWTYIQLLKSDIVNSLFTCTDKILFCIIKIAGLFQGPEPF